MCRKVLNETFVNETIGIGGVFYTKKGSLLHSVQQNCTTPIITQEESQKWSLFKPMSAPAVGVGIIVSNDKDFDLRPFHFHVFSQNNLGGHYWYDTTPEIVEYEAYFNVAERVVRIDRPDEPWQFKN